MSQAPVGTVFLGSGSFAVPTLEVVAAHPALDLVAVVSAPDRPAGRGQRARAVPAAAVARERGLPLRQPTRLRDEGELAAILELGPELVVVADYGQIVPRVLLEVRRGALNLHPSLLPRHRGASPIAATILEGDRETGVTIIRMDEGVDTGPIVAQERVALRGNETAPQLEARLAGLGAQLLGATIEDWLARAIAPVPQPPTGATVTHPLRRSEGRLDWQRSATELERQVRAFQPWPGSFTDSPVGRLTIWGSAVLPAGQGEPGLVVPHGAGIAVVCGSDALELIDVQLPGKRRMSGRDLRNGHPELVAARLG